MNMSQRWHLIYSVSGADLDAIVNYVGAVAFLGLPC